MRSQWVCAALITLVAGGSPGDAGTNREAASASQAPVSLQDSGDAAGMHFDKLPSAPGVYVVTFSNDGQRVLVSDSFLALILKHKGMPSEVKLKAIRSYPDMVAANFETIMNSTFPDQSQSPAEPFEAIECTSLNGAVVTVEQDTLASPYVRVKVRDRTGMTESYSINRRFVEDLLRQEGMNGERLAETIVSFPFRLPEDARSGFTRLSRAQLDELVLHTPAFQKQEIIRMPRFYREEATNVMAQLSNAAPLTAMGAAVQPVPPETVSQGEAKISRRLSSVRKDPTPPQAPERVVPTSPTPPPAAPDRRHVVNWLAVSGWVVAIVAVCWAVMRRRR